MQFDYRDYEKFHKGMMDRAEAEKFLEWLESPAGEKSFQKWVEDNWNEPSAVLRQNFSSTKGRETVKRIHFSPNLQNVAAALLLLLTAVFVFYLNKDSVPPAEYQTSIQPTDIIKSAPKGKKTTVTLSDGSKVYLNSESEIHYQSNFKDNRTLKLIGEAFFEVVSDSLRPFTVITNEISTQALGTSFNINAYREKKEIFIGLVSGKIVVESSKNTNDKFFVQPGEGIGYGLENEMLYKKEIDVNKIGQWKSGIIEFENMPLDEVLHLLERWYDVEVHIEDGKRVPKELCTGKFKPHEYLTNVLESLSHAIDFDYSIENKKVILNFN
jgi:transmembrane sensor